MDDIAKYRDLVSKLFESDNDVASPLSRQDIAKQKQERDKIRAMQDAWQKREQSKGKQYRGITYASFPWTIERSFPDEDGEFQEVDIQVHVSGEYEKGSSGSSYEPSYSDAFHGIDIEWAEIDSPNSDTPPLTMAEKIKLEKEFNAPNSKLHDAAEQALFDQR